MRIPADNRCRDSFVSGKAVAVAVAFVYRKAIDEAVSNSSSSLDSTPASAFTYDKRRQVDICWGISQSMSLR